MSTKAHASDEFLMDTYRINTKVNNNHKAKNRFKKN